MKTKTSKEVQDVRVHTLLSQVIQGHTRRDMVAYAYQQWGTPAWQVDKYLTIARALMRSELKEHRRSILAEHIAARRLIRKIAFDNNDLHLALDVLKDEAKVLGLYESDLLDRVDQLEQALTNGNNE